jgi:hypothetical protein
MSAMLQMLIFHECTGGRVHMHMIDNGVSPKDMSVVMPLPATPVAAAT